MTTVYTNNKGIELPLAVWLVSDSYDGYSPDPYTVSVTTLLKGIRQIVLTIRQKLNTQSVNQIDLSDLVRSRLGTSVHDSLEKVWTDKNNLLSALSKLGYSDETIAKVKINPTHLNPDDIPVYVEQRNRKSVGKWVVSGKYDMVLNHQVHDLKTTSTYSWIKGNNDTKYSIQGSIYRWLNPEIIKHDDIAIHFVFTDYKVVEAYKENYPDNIIKTKNIPLMSLDETENFIKHKLAEIEANLETPESLLPVCSDEDLWRDPPVFKYYKKGVVAARSTRTFDTMDEAIAQKLADGGFGLVVESKGKAKACKWCSAAALCSHAVV